MKEPRTKVEAFVESYIKQLVAKPAGTSVAIPYTSESQLEVRNAISLWMSRYITKSQTGWYSMSHQKTLFNYTVTLKKDHK